MLDDNGNNEQHLVDQLKKGSQEAFTIIFNKYSNDIYLTARKILPDEDLCDDIVQDIFEWLWQHREQLEIRSLKLYLISAARFKVLNLIKKGKYNEIVAAKLSERSDLPESAELQYEVKELQHVIRQFTDELPPQASRIFNLSRIEHYSNKEIAKQLGISEKTVKKQINISLKKLRIKLGKKSYLLFLL